MYTLYKHLYLQPVSRILTDDPPDPRSCILDLASCILILQPNPGAWQMATDEPGSAAYMLMPLRICGIALCAGGLLGQEGFEQKPRRWPVQTVLFIRVFWTPTLYDRHDDISYQKKLKLD